LTAANQTNSTQHVTKRVLFYVSSVHQIQFWLGKLTALPRLSAVIGEGKGRRIGNGFKGGVRREKGIWENEGEG